MRLHSVNVCLCAILGNACSTLPPDQPPRPAQQPQRPSTSDTPSPVSWQDAFDLDGDGTNDRIVSEFTGGGHCCYRIGATLSSTGKTTIFPFEMDGGYPLGLDLSRADQLTVRTRAGSLPEIVYQIATYNGEPEPLDPAWTRRWQIRTHRVALCFAGGQPQARDDAPDLPACAR
jgi:hypothetical protein